ncbi:MAG TPA: AAA family ATPase [Acidimicrobiales bacterium]|nr:AAA family ATPase [Acidimicrobiales bacterium]
MTQAELVGRRREVEVLDRLTDAALGRRGGALVLHGDPGVGKTALLDRAVRQGSEFRVVRTAGVEGEMRLPYAALQQLCAPSIHLLEHLPPPQQDAVVVAFGLGEGRPPEVFLVGLAVLGLLSKLAEERPLLCIVDDAHWLDDGSARALAFVARRLLAERIALVFSTRTMGGLLAGLPELHVEPLGHRDSRALLDSILPVRLDETVLERILLETRGNPLAIVEMPRGLTPAQLAGGFGVLTDRSLSDGIEASFARRLATLTPPARQLLLVAAAEPLGDPALLSKAAELLGIPRSAVHEVEALGLVAFGAEVAFRHPLARSAIYQAAQPDERRRVHRALAEATDGAAHPDRRAWHLGQGASLPDEEVAIELEHSAARAQARGGFAAAAAFLERSAALTPAAPRRAGRALAAAQAMLQAGAFDDATRLVATAEDGGLTELERARAALVRGRIAFLVSRSSDATDALLQAADQLREVDEDLARETYLEALSTAIFAGPLAKPGAASRDVAEAARAAPTAQAPRVSDLLLDGLVTVLTDAYASAVPTLQAARRAIDGVSTTEQLRWLWATTVSSLLLWDDDGWESLSDRHSSIVRETGALSELPIALSHRGQLHVFAGELESAATLQEAIQEVTRLTGSPLAPYHAAALTAMCGRESEATQFLTAARAEVQRRGEGAGLSFMDWAESLLYNGLGRYAQALAAARRVFEHSQLVELNWALPELIEAAIRVGDRDLAEAAGRCLSDRTRASGTEWALGIGARSQALLAHGDRADELYREAIDRLARTRLAVDLARSHLLYGEWLRREQRKKDGRVQLRTAYDLFVRFGMQGFARRAEAELRATGDRARRRDADTHAHLTPQEQRISELVAEGATNKDIAAQIYVSPATVEYHLHKAFRKLGVTSRTQLAQVVLQSSRQAAAE